MNAITRNTPKQTLRVHATTPDGRPVCGGGHLARLVTEWQSDLAAPNCAACLAILAKRALKLPPPDTHALV